MNIDPIHIDAQNYNQESIEVDLTQFVNKDKLQELVKYLNFSYNISLRHDIKPFEATLSNKNILYLIHSADYRLHSGKNLSNVDERLYSLTKNLFSSSDIKVDMQLPKGDKAKEALLSETYGDGIVLSSYSNKNIFERLVPAPKVDKTPPIFSLSLRSDDEKKQLYQILVEDMSSLNSHLIFGGTDLGTFLHCVIVNEQYENLRYLLETYSVLIDPSSVDAEKKTILITASKVHAPSDVIKSILKSKLTKLDINARDNQGATALHYACLYGRLDLVKELIKRGANQNIVDNEGRTPIDWARQNRGFIKHQFETISIDGERDARATRNFLAKVSLGFFGILISKSNIDQMISKIETDPHHADYEHLDWLKQVRNNLLGKSLIELCEEGQKDVINYLSP